MILCVINKRNTRGHYMITIETKSSHENYTDVAEFSKEIHWKSQTKDANKRMGHAKKIKNNK